MKRFRAHTHFIYLLCVHSLHMSLVTLAHYCFMLLCVLVSCNSFPVVVRKRPLIARRSPLENAFGFSLGFTILGETAVTFCGLAVE